MACGALCTHHVAVLYGTTEKLQLNDIDGIILSDGVDDEEEVSTFKSHRKLLAKEPIKPLTL